MKYVGPPPNPIPSRVIRFSTRLGSHASHRWIGTPSSTGHSNPPSMPMKCPTGNAVRLSGGMLRMAGIELTDLAAQGLVAVHDALGIAGGARGEGDQRRARTGSVSTVPAIGSAARRSSKSRPTSPTIGTSTHRSAW